MLPDTSPLGGKEYACFSSQESWLGLWESVCGTVDLCLTHRKRIKQMAATSRSALPASCGQTQARTETGRWARASLNPVQEGSCQGGGNRTTRVRDSSHHLGPLTSLSRCGHVHFHSAGRSQSPHGKQGPVPMTTPPSPAPAHPLQRHLHAAGGGRGARLLSC